MRLITDIVKECQEVQKGFEQHHDTDAIKKCIETYIGLLNEANDDPEILFQLATGYIQIRQFGMAEQLFLRALCHWPNNPHAWSNLGVCYRSMHVLPKARDCFMKSLMLQELPESLNNMASCYINENAPDKGIPYAKRAIELDPNGARPKWNAGLLFLEMQDWETGFTLYEAGFHCGERPMRFYTNNPEKDIPWWEGQKDCTVVLWDEQGIGDRLLAINLIRKLRGKVKVILECHPRLEAIYRRSFPWIDHIYPTIKEDKIDWPTKHKIDYKIPVASLARRYWTAGNFNRNPYIRPNPELVKKYRAEMEAKGKGPYIGFSWAGGVTKTNTQYRSLKLNWFKPLIEMGGTWFSLQYHDWAKDKVERFREETNLPVWHMDAAQEFDYDHTLAALAACDLVLSANNSVVHTAGAAGVPCWVLTPSKRAWRYPKGEQFPWYGDHMRQFHQEKDGDWDGVLETVKKELSLWTPA